MLIRNKNNDLKFLFIALALMSFSAYASDAERLNEKQKQLKQQYIELERNNLGYMTKKIELETTESKLRRLKRNAAKERRALDDMIEAQSKSPDVDYSDKIESQRAVWRKANKTYISQKEYVELLHDKFSDNKIQYKVTQQKIVNMQQSINDMVKSMADSELSKQMRDLRKSQQIKITAVETCSLTVTKDDCIDKARVRAERDAAERGSLVVIDAVTEVKNFNLTKDEVRSRVSARISNIQVFKKTFDLNAEKSGWRVEYGITATVTPAIHDEMRSQLKSQIISIFNANVNIRDVSTIELPEYVELPPEEVGEEDVAVYSEPVYSAPAYIAPVYIAPAAPAEIVPEVTAQELRDETEREMEEIRTEARSKGLKKEAKEAKDELDSREITIMVF